LISFEVILTLTDQQLAAIATAEKDFSHVGLTISTTNSMHISIFLTQDSNVNGPSLQVILAQLCYSSPLASFSPGTVWYPFGKKTTKRNI